MGWRETNGETEVKTIVRMSLIVWGVRIDRHWIASLEPPSIRDG